MYTGVIIAVCMYMDGNVGPGLMGDFTPFDSTNVSLFKFSSNLPGNTDISGLLEDPVYWFSLVFSLTRKNKGKLFHSATAILSSSFAEDFFSFREEWA